MAVDFGEVRSALHANPSSLGWERLCRLCEDALVRVAHNEALGGLEVFGISGAKLDERLVDALGAVVARCGVGALRLMGCEGLNERLGRASLWRQITRLEMGDDKYRGYYEA